MTLSPPDAPMTTNGTDLTEAFAKAIDSIPGHAFARLAEAVGVAPYEEHSSMHENSLRVAQAVVATVRAQAPSLLAVQREAWDAARDFSMQESRGEMLPDVVDSLVRLWNRERDRRFPLPVEGVTLSDGSVVTYKGENGWMERVISEPNYSPPARLICSSDCWRDLLTEPTDTDDDFNALKAYASAQEKR